MTKNQWLAKLHELAFEDTRLDKIPFQSFEALAEGIANIQAAEHSVHPTLLTPSEKIIKCPECHHLFTIYIAPPQSG